MKENDRGAGLYKGEGVIVNVGRCFMQEEEKVYLGRRGGLFREGSRSMYLDDRGGKTLHRQMVYVGRAYGLYCEGRWSMQGGEKFYVLERGDGLCREGRSSMQRGENVYVRRGDGLYRDGEGVFVGRWSMQGREKVYVQADGLCNEWRRSMQADCLCMEGSRSIQGGEKVYVGRGDDLYSMQAAKMVYVGS